MEYLIVSGSRQPDGLFDSVMSEIVRGVTEGGADAQILALEGLGRCKACNDGWGVCRSEHICAFGKDGFHEAQRMVKQADALCLITPIVLGEPSEAVKNFLERIRHCESGDFRALENKPLLITAFPESSDSGLFSYMEQIDKFCRQTGAVIFDFLSVNRWNSDYQKASAYSAGKAMAYGRKAGEALSRKRRA